MPVDGTYGRFRAHNQRVKDLRRRKNKKMGRNFFKPIKVKNVISEEVKPDKLEKIKLDIRTKINSDQKREYLILLVIFLVVIAVTIVLFYRL